jgi:hypothetical protein
LVVEDFVVEDLVVEDLVVGFAVAAALELSLRFAVPRAAGFETTALRAAF